MADLPRAYTPTEVRDLIVDHARNVAAYWAALPDIDPATGHRMTMTDRCDGVAFSLLTMLDGDTTTIPAITLKLDPHPDDHTFHQSRGENWFEPGMEISETLHEYFYREPNQDQSQ